MKELLIRSKLAGSDLMKIWYVNSRDIFFIYLLYQGAIRYHEIWAVVVP